MEIGTSQLSLAVPARNAPAMVQAWQAGQIIEARVAKVGPGQGTVLLQLPQGEVEARSDLMLQPGDRLRLMAEPRDGVWLLRMLPNPTAGQPVAAALRQALPRQLPLGPALSSLLNAAADPGSPLPAGLRQAIALLAGSLSPPQQLATSEGLRRALLDSGLFLESKLAQTPPGAVEKDLKAQLLRLLARLDKAGGGSPDGDDGTTGAPEKGGLQELGDLLRQLTRQTEGAVARIQWQQLRALPEQTGQETPLVIEIPVQKGKETETLTLRFEREGGGDTEGREKSWSVRLDLSDARHGAIRAVVRFAAGLVSTRFFAERPATADLFRNHLPALSERLQAAGLAVGSVDALAGIPASEERSLKGLLSERA